MGLKVFKPNVLKKVYLWMRITRETGMQVMKIPNKL